MKQNTSTMDASGEDYVRLKQETERRVCLGLLLVIGFNHPIWFYLVRWMRPDLYDVLWQRCVVGGTALLLASYFWKKNIQYLRGLKWALVFSCCLMIVQYYYLAAINNISTMHSLGIIMIMTLGGVMIDFLKGLATYLAVCCLGATYISFFVDSPHHPQGMIFVVVINIALLLLFNGYSRIKSDSKINRMSIDLANAQKALIEQAHRSGMADIATNILHNVGNILNSFNICVESMRHHLESSPLKKMVRANDLFRNKSSNLTEFAKNDERVPKILSYFIEIENLYKKHENELTHETQRMKTFSEAMQDVVMAQQDLAAHSNNSLRQQIRLNHFVNETIDLFHDELMQEKISVVKDYALDCELMVHKSKLLHVITNLIKNAKSALKSRKSEKILEFKINQEGNNIALLIKDNGHGILKEDIEQIFQHGFSKHPNGKGFGLHSSVNYMHEMQGTLSVTSHGQGHGACFKLTFPMALSLNPKEKKCPNS